MTVSHRVVTSSLLLSLLIPVRPAPMKILVANLGSTSFKYRLYDMPSGSQCARGAIDRIGDEASHCSVEVNGETHETQTHVADHAAAVAMCLQQLGESHGGMPPLKDASELSGIGFKAVFAGRLSGVRRVGSG